MLRLDLVTREADGLDVLALIIDVILPVREWFCRMVDRLLDVSDEIVDKGRGMNSTVSENPTRGRDGPSNDAFA